MIGMVMYVTSRKTIAGHEIWYPLFADPKSGKEAEDKDETHNNLILLQNVRLSMNTRREGNQNVLVIEEAGAGKTCSW